jgi:ribosomal protein L6P/L9E
MVQTFFDERGLIELYCEYDDNEVFRLGGNRGLNCACYLPDNFLVGMHSLTDTEVNIDIDEFNFGDNDVWFDPFVFCDNSIELLEQLSWLCDRRVFNTNLYNMSKLPIFISLSAYRKVVVFNSTYIFTIMPRKSNKNHKKWFVWFHSYQNLSLTAVFFRFMVYTVWFKTVGDGASCSCTDSKHVHVNVGENHDIVFKASQFIFIKQKQNPRIFGCFSFHQASLLQFAHKIRSYYRFNVYQYRGILFLFERVTKKVTKRRLR